MTQYLPRVWMLRLQSCALASVAVMIAVPMAAQNVARRSARDVQVRIETDKDTYRIGDTIKVRLTLRNISSRAIQFREDVPRGYVRLRVTDSASRPLDVDYMLIEQTLSGRWGDEVQLKGGEERTLQWQHSEWMNLQDWGYKLEKPGRYAISGAPVLWGDKIVRDTSIRSNEVTITVSGR